MSSKKSNNKIDRESEEMGKELESLILEEEKRNKEREIAISQARDKKYKGPRESDLKESQHNVERKK